MSTTKNILFIASHRVGRSPSQRFRFEQYFEFLQANGYNCQLSNLLSAEDDKKFYQTGNAFNKATILINSYIKRWKDVRRAKNCDIIFVQREAFMTGSTYFEKKFSRLGKKMVFDFDDSIWILDTSNANKKWEWLKDANKTSRIIGMSDLIFAGNPYLADYAKQFNKNVLIVPTTIDTGKQIKVNYPNKNNRVCIGWSGSITTIKHFEYALPFLLKLKQKYGDKIHIKVIGDGSYRHEELGITGIGWNEKDEIKELSEIDIGIMPLPHDEWTKGKCGLKGLQYMALEIATIMSPVGVNTEIIQDGVNGYLADTEEEWVNRISLLIEDEALRKEIGKQGRKTVENQYSVEAQKNTYLRAFNELLSR